MSSVRFSTCTHHARVHVIFSCACSFSTMRARCSCNNFVSLINVLNSYYKYNHKYPQYDKREKKLKKTVHVYQIPTFTVSKCPIILIAILDRLTVAMGNPHQRCACVGSAKHKIGLSLYAFYRANYLRSRSPSKRPWSSTKHKAMAYDLVLRSCFCPWMVLLHGLCLRSGLLGIWEIYVVLLVHVKM